MATIASEVNLATQADISEIKIKCAEHSTKNALMAQKLDNIEKILNKLVVFQETLFDKLNDKFAGKFVEEEIIKMKAKEEDKLKEENKKNYDWLKYVITTIVGVILGLAAKVFNQ